MLGDKSANVPKSNIASRPQGKKAKEAYDKDMDARGNVSGPKGRGCWIKRKCGLARIHRGVMTWQSLISSVRIIVMCD